MDFVYHIQNVENVYKLKIIMVLLKRLLKSFSCAQVCFWYFLHELNWHCYLAKHCKPNLDCRREKGRREDTRPVLYFVLEELVKRFVEGCLESAHVVLSRFLVSIFARQMCKHFLRLID